MTRSTDCTCKSNNSIPGFFHGTNCSLRRDGRLIFPCGAYFSINEWPVDGAHYAASGAVRFNVFPGDRPDLSDEVVARVKNKHGINYDGKRAPCEFFCPTPGKRKEQRGFSRDGTRAKFISCFAKLYEEHRPDAKAPSVWVNITPPAPDKCPHCQEQQSYVAACKRAARQKTAVPDRELWRKCPQCSHYQEVSVDTGLCSTCQEVDLMWEKTW
jgi:hypothetical protein